MGKLVVKKGSLMVCKYCFIDYVEGEMIYQTFSGIVLGKSFCSGKLSFLYLRNRFFSVKVDLKLDLWFPSMVGVSLLLSPSSQLKGGFLFDL